MLTTHELAFSLITSHIREIIMSKLNFIPQHTQSYANCIRTNGQYPRHEPLDPSTNTGHR